MSTVTKGGRQLIKMIDKYDMKLVTKKKKYAKGYGQESKGRINQKLTM